MVTIPEQLKEVVTFVFIKDHLGRLQPIGTGFFVGVRDEKKRELFHVYFVTARHVLLDSQGQYYRELSFRVNKKSGGSEILEAPLSAPKGIDVLTHRNRAVDIAVLPLAPNRDIFQFRFVPEDMIATKKRFAEANIKEGDEVLFTGLFTAFFGAGRNYPIVRFGRVAMLTKERIPWQGEMLELYLIECQSFGGNSGSPVFFHLGPIRESGKVTLGSSEFLLAGILKGYFTEPRAIRFAGNLAVPISLENAGIAAVIPAYQLHEILLSDRPERARPSRRKYLSVYVPPHSAGPTY